MFAYIFSFLWKDNRYAEASGRTYNKVSLSDIDREMDSKNKTECQTDGRKYMHIFIYWNRVNWATEG